MTDGKNDADKTFVVETIRNPMTGNKGDLRGVRGGIHVISAKSVDEVVEALCGANLWNGYFDVYFGEWRLEEETDLGAYKMRRYVKDLRKGQVAVQVVGDSENWLEEATMTICEASMASL